MGEAAFGQRNIGVNSVQFNHCRMQHILHRLLRIDEIGAPVLTESGEPGVVHRHFGPVDADAGDRNAAGQSAEGIEQGDRQATATTVPTAPPNKATRRKRTRAEWRVAAAKALAR